MYYEVTVSYQTLNEKGVLKSKREKYITDVNIFCEAEMKGFSIEDSTMEEFDVVDVKRSKVKEIAYPLSEDLVTYKATVVDIFVSEDGSEKEIKYDILLGAEDMPDAQKKMTEFLKEGYDMRLDKIERTKIITEVK